MTTQNVHQWRRGSTLLELIVATALLGVVFATVAPVFSWLAAERRAADQTQLASLEVANVMERLAQTPWETLSDVSTKNIALSESARKHLDEARLTVRVVEETGPPAAKRVNVELTWRNRADQFVAPMRLTAWVFK